MERADVRFSRSPKKLSHRLYINDILYKPPSEPPVAKRGSNPDGSLRAPEPQEETDNLDTEQEM